VTDEPPPGASQGALTWQASRVQRRLPWLLVLLVCVAAGVGYPQWTEAQTAAHFAVTGDDLTLGRTELAALPVQDNTTLDGYDRDAFGQAWADVDHNGCRTRDDILARDLTDLVVDDDDCTVLSGTLDDPYTGESIAFARGENSAAVQIDHVVALANAWRSGARDWDADTRLAFANDPANLLAVEGGANQSKGADDASQWLPREGFQCLYGLTQIKIKTAYELSITSEEKAALAETLAGCRTE